MALIACSNCGHQVSTKAPECPECGAAPIFKFCTKCGAAVSHAETNCPSCNADLDIDSDFRQPGRGYPSNSVLFKNPRTGESKAVKVGWSWTLFFFAGILGIPLFLRGLNVWGAVFALIWAVNLFLPGINSIVLGLFIALPLEIWIAAKGNEMTAKNYLERGWAMLEPNSNVARDAKLKWGLLR